MAGQSDVGEVVLEVRTDEGWRRMGSQGAAEPPGSLSSHEPLGRQVYVFGWLPSGEGPGVWRSACGADVETPAFRQIATTGFDRVADLTTGPYQLVRYQAEGGTRTVRFRWLTALVTYLDT